METVNNQSDPSIDVDLQHDELDDLSVWSYMDNKGSETEVLCHILVSNASID
jgi:hypothetical protein